MVLPAIVQSTGLLLPHRPEEVVAQNRRPADIFLPSLHGTPAALDLAIMAPQRQDIVAQAAGAALAAASAYAATKASLEHCPPLRPARVRFVPIVAESTGAWDREAGQILLQIACSAAARTGDAASTSVLIPRSAPFGYDLEEEDAAGIESAVAGLVRAMVDPNRSASS